MAHQKRQDTKPEVVLRKRLHARGYRFRVAYPVPGMPRRTIDIAFPRRRVAVFVDGCFWHACPTHGVKPKNNKDWWADKLAGNRVRRRRRRPPGAAPGGGGGGRWCGCGSTRRPKRRWRRSSQNLKGNECTGRGPVF